MARHFLDVFRGAEYIVVPSGSCTSMIAHHYEDMFEKDAAMLRAVHALAPRVYEFSQFLIEVAEVDDVGARFDGVVTYHDSCHALRELKIKDGTAPAAREGQGSDTARDGCGGGMLRVRRHVLGQVSGSLGRHGAHQDRFDSEDRGRHRGVDRFQLSDADSRRDAARGIAGSHHAPGGSSGQPLNNTS